MINLLSNYKNIILFFYYQFIRISFDFFMIGAHFLNPDLATKIGNEISWKIDGTFKNNPDNIWYEGPSK